MWAILLAAGFLAAMVTLKERRDRPRPAKVKAKERRWALIAPTFSVFWVAGIGFAWWLVVPPLLWFHTRSSKSRKAPGRQFLVLGWWLAGVLLASVASGATSSGVSGAAYGAVMWISAGLAAIGLDRATAAQRVQFFRGLAFLVVAQGALTLAAVRTHPGPLSSLRLPSSQFLEGLGGVAPWTTANLAYVDYFGQTIVRSSGIMATAAWSGGFACLMALALLIYRKPLLAAGVTRRLWTVTVLASLVSLYYSYSRVSWLLLILFGGVWITFTVAKRLLKEAGPAIAALGLAVAVVLGGTFLPWLSLLQEQDALRPGSSSVRFQSYSEGVRSGTTQGPLVFIAGSGAKPDVVGLAHGAGSESTWASLFVRGGVVGVGLFSVAVISLINDRRRRGDLGGVLVGAALAAHALVEDLDVGTLTLLILIAAGRFVPDDTESDPGEPQLDDQRSHVEGGSRAV